jgi:hypothetical protein
MLRVLGSRAIAARRIAPRYTRPKSIFSSFKEK